MNRRNLVSGIIGTTAVLCAFPARSASPKKGPPKARRQQRMPSLKGAIAMGRHRLVAAWPKDGAVHTGAVVATSGVFITVGDFAANPLTALTYGRAEAATRQIYFDAASGLSAHRPLVPPPPCESFALADRPVSGWAVGLYVGDAGVTGALGQPSTAPAAGTATRSTARFDLPCPPGSAVVDATGQLAGLVRRRHGVNQCDVVPAGALRAFLVRVARSGTD